ncbi:LacI family DNA-binding transcriptional regulator [Sphingomonas sp. JC676]|uniref:LacI family DNA-binding transcriptional regulator n=1 Tax=Sphingomonas sp. JC676 TaxID=2768065 RepID=UPI00165836B9|nr:LacI family DNA-binding transcriptional regulator [Sphingomonas sp. JC676]MBC9032917.1 LacI family DNA-binding transcriptional regulator [Sphingomonas sp. JC676]
MPTIIQVAAMAGVSTATVSRVLSHPNRVAEETRRRVLDVVDSLGYKPNVAARTLRTLRAAKILVTVPDISNPFFASVIRGAEEAARDAGYAVVVGDTRHDPLIEDQYADMLSGREVDGLIFLGHRLPDNLRPLVSKQGARAPVVNGCEYSPDIGVPSVHIDNAAAGRDAVEHLIGLGHRDIGVITGPPVSPISRDRLTGAMQAAECHGLGDRLQVRIGDYSAQSAFDLMGDLISRGVTGLFCFSDEMAMGAISAIRQAGLTCPDDISVIGFDDLPLARFFQPGLTTIAQPKGLIGHHAVDLLVGILSGTDNLVNQITLPHELVVRRSTRKIG